jgi:hypothetical protein
MQETGKTGKQKQGNVSSVAHVYAALYSGLPVLCFYGIN